MSETENTKGRPTPKRKEAEAARKKTLKVPADKKAARIAMRERENSARLESRKALYTNDEKHLPRRDKGQVRRFVRNFVDRQVSVGELFVPFAFVIMIFLFVPNREIQTAASSVWLVMFLGMAVDSIVLTFRVRRAVRKEFGDAELKGVGSYAIMRSLTFRPMRLPKPLVKVGGTPRPVKVPKSLNNL
ncbi:MAG: hypothetical protein RL038_977 [Actinomycetota bacterium]|jgi:hypothetical protein